MIVRSVDVIDAIRQRKSVRGFMPRPIHRAVLEEILEIAVRSPSGMNIQPWEITVIAGEVLDDIRRGIVEALRSGIPPNPDVEYEEFIGGSYRQRRVDVGIQLYGLMGIAREDRVKRSWWSERGFRFFDAPAAIVVASDRSLSESRCLLDVGIIAQSICLAALGYALGTCVLRQGVMYPDVIREFTNMPKSKRIAISIAIGYPDWDFPANKLETTRQPVNSITSWHGFDEPWSQGVR